MSINSRAHNPQSQERKNRVDHVLTRLDLRFMIVPTQLPWASLYASLSEKGYATVPQLLSKNECEQLIQLYNDPARYRSIINMQRYRFGRGEYKYFSYPLPSLIQEIREEMYPHLATLANEWMRQVGLPTSYPSDHAAFIEQCRQQGQLRPTPLILQYQAGGYNTLHQDLYGDIYFPFQLVILLTQVGRDHEGGELVLVEQIPRAQSKAEVIRPNQGDAIIFTTNFRPVKGTRGFYRANIKHGVSEITRGQRYATGIIFHDAA